MRRQQTRVDAAPRIEMAPLSRAIRIGLATSVVAVAFGAGASTLDMVPLRVPDLPILPARTALDDAPVVDLAVVRPHRAVRMQALPAAAAIDEAAAGDIAIDNSAPITVVEPGDAFAIRADSSDGDVRIANRAGATLDATSEHGRVTGIHARGQSVDVGNDAAIRARGLALAHAIDVQAAFGDARVRNAGAIDVASTMNSRVMGTLGISVQASRGSASVENSGAVTVTGGGLAVALSTTGGNSRVANAGALAVTGRTSNGIIVSGDVGEVNNSGDVLAQGDYSHGIRLFGTEEASLVNTGDLDVRGEAWAIGLYAGNALADGQVDLSHDGTISTRAAVDATGISARGGVVAVDADGSIAALGGRSGIGISAGATRSLVIDSDADIVVSGGARATAIEARASAGPIRVRNGGTLQARFARSVFGIDARADTGRVEIDNSGALDVAGFESFGIFARGDVAEVVNGGDIVAGDGGDMTAYGAQVIGTQRARLANTGDITVRGGHIGFGLSVGNGGQDGEIALSSDGTLQVRTSNFATGIDASGGVVDIATAGSITVQAGQSSKGVRALASRTLKLANAADIQVSATGAQAIGIDATLAGTGTMTLHNEGAISASATYNANAHGILARADDGAIALVNAGQLQATAQGGVAYGIDATGRAVQVANTGSIDSQLFGISVVGDTVAVSNSGSVRGLTGNRTRIGIQAHGVATAQVENTGSVEIGATSRTGSAINVSGGAISAVNKGKLAVDESGRGATGIYANGASVAVRNEGEITVKGARGAIGAATGIAARAQGDIAIANTGTIRVQEQAGHESPLPGGVVGVAMESVDGSAALDNRGTIAALPSSAARSRAAFAVRGGAGDNVIRNRGMIEGAIVTGAGDDLFENASEGTWLLGGSYSASVFGGGNDRIANAGTVAVRGSHRAILSGGRFDNTGIIDLVDDAPDDSFRVDAATFGGKGALRIDLDPANGRADHLGVSGDMAADAVQTVNVKVPGLPTSVVSAPVQFATVDGTSVAGNFVGGQVIGWNPADFLRLGVIVSSDIDAGNTRPDRFLASTYVSGLNDAGALTALAAVGATQFAHVQIGSLRQRIGAGMLEDPERRVGVFLRGYAAQGDVDPGHQALDFDQGGNFLHEQSSWGRELGVGVRLVEHLHAGLLFGKADSRQRLAGPGVGENRFSGNSQGAYLTWYQPNGAYLDLSARSMDADIRSTSPVGLWGGKARLRAYSVEAGYEWEWEGVTFVPQAQYTRAEASGIAPFQGANVALVADDAASSRGRLGLEVKKTIVGEGIRVTPFLSLSAVREFDGRAGYTVANHFHGTFERKGASSLVGLGLDVQKGALGLSIGSQWTYGGAKDNGSGAQAIIRYSW